MTIALHRSWRNTGLVLFALLFALAVVRPAGAATGDLYAVTGSGGGSSNEGCTPPDSQLYKLDPATAAPTLVGPILVGATPVKSVTGIAIHPTTGQMYAVASPCDNFGFSTLYAVDKATGAATVIGSVGGMAEAQIPDISFDPFGNLYGWNEWDDDLIKIDITNGTFTQVGECGCGTAQTGLAINSAGAIYAKSGSELDRINHVTGTIVDSVSMDDFAHNIASFSPTDVLYTGERGAAGPTAFTLMTVDVATGHVTTVGSNAIQRISAIEFDRGVVTPPPVADLSLTKSVDDDTPEVGQDVDFTLTVSNAGPANATGVHVTDALPAGFAFVSSNASQGGYDDSTGDWNVGTVNASASATLVITATTLSTGSGYTNNAEISASGAFDMDSFPGDADPAQDDRATQVTTPFDPDLDATVSVDVNGPTRAAAKNKGFVVTVSNAGTTTFTVTNSNLVVTVEGTSSVVSCRTFTAVLAPGTSARVRCTAALVNLGLSPGDSVDYSATVNLVLDAVTGNNSDTATFTAK
jgi:uncharacterized repeat protein (TIGR01451 family)